MEKRMDSYMETGLMQGFPGSYWKLSENAASKALNPKPPGPRIRV